MTTGLETTAIGAAPSFAAALPTGIVSWEDAGGVAVWFVLAALVGTLLGILRERTSPRVQTSDVQTSEAVHADPAADGHLPHAA